MGATSCGSFTSQFEDARGGDTLRVDIAIEDAIATGHAPEGTQRKNAEGKVARRSARSNKARRIFVR